MSALLVAGADRLAALGAAVRIGTAIAVFALVLTIVCAMFARFASRRAPRRLGRGDPPLDVAVADSLSAFRAVDDSTPVLDVQRLALEHWHGPLL